MTSLLIVVGLIGLGGLGMIFWKISQIQSAGTDGTMAAEKEELIRQCAELKAHLDRKAEEMGTLKAELDAQKEEKNEQHGKGKQLFTQYTKLEAKYEELMEKHDALKKEISQYEAQDVRREKDFEAKLAKLETAKISLDQERQRVIQADEDRRKQEEEERDRLWADHENTVIAHLTDLCKQPVLSFTSYSNTNLPEGFDGSLKPDFMIDFLGQYVIFDAKVSKAKSLKDYIADQVKKTVGKVKNDERIYKSIFLVVPSAALQELKTHHHIVDGYSLFVIGPESLAPILASLKRISMYEFAEQMDPQQRENIVQLIAELDFHINLRNAADILLTKMGTDILEKAQKIDPALAEEVALKKQPMNAKASVAAADLKKLVAKLIDQNDEIARLVAPTARVRKQDLKVAGSVMEDSLFS